MPAPAAQPRLRRRIEFAIRLAAPVLDLTLAVGERLSRLLEREDPDYVPARLPLEGESAPRGLRRHAERTRLAMCATAMSADEQLRYEAAVKPRQAVIAAVAAVLLVGAAAIQLAGHPHEGQRADARPDHRPQALPARSDRRDRQRPRAAGAGGDARVPVPHHPRAQPGPAHLHPVARARRRRRRRRHGDRLRGRHRQQGLDLRQPRRSDLPAGQPPDELRRAAGAAVPRPGVGARARGRLRAHLAERDAGRAAHPLHGLPGHLHRHPRAVPDRLPGPGGAGVLAAGARLPAHRPLAVRRAAELAQRPGRGVAVGGRAARAADEGGRARGGGRGARRAGRRPRSTPKPCRPPAASRPRPEPGARTRPTRTRATTPKRKRKKRR